MPLLTKEQINRARSVDLLDYLQAFEPGNVRKSKGSVNEYYLVEHDSLKMSNGKWFRHSTQQGGYSALDFLIKVRGVHFIDAVQSLTGGNAITEYKAITKSSLHPPKPKSFKLPEPALNNDRAVAYLRERGISKNVIYGCIKTGLLYESNNRRCAFIGKNENGQPRFACERGITDDLKKDVYGSSKQSGFVIPPNEPNGHSNTSLALFESPIDCMAYSSIQELKQTSWDGYKLSLGGVSTVALYGFLERNPQITSIRLCLDNDKPGHDATNRIIKELLGDKRYSHIKIKTAPPPIGKDYCDTVLAIKQNIISKSTIDRPKEAAF